MHSVTEKISIWQKWLPCMLPNQAAYLHECQKELVPCLHLLSSQRAYFNVLFLARLGGPFNATGMHLQFLALLTLTEFWLEFCRCNITWGPVLALLCATNSATWGDWRHQTLLLPLLGIVRVAFCSQFLSFSAILLPKTQMIRCRWLPGGWHHLLECLENAFLVGQYLAAVTAVAMFSPVLSYTVGYMPQHVASKGHLPRCVFGASPEPFLSYWWRPKYHDGGSP